MTEDKDSRLTMVEDQVQPPRYTSTPLAGRKTSNILNNFIEVSPIYSTADNRKKSKSNIPISVPTTYDRSNGGRSTIGSTKARSANGSGQGSSGLLSIPSQTQNPKAGKKTSSSGQASKKDAAEVLPLKPRTEPQIRTSIDQAIGNIIHSLSEKENITTAKEPYVKAVSTKIPLQTQAPEVVPKDEPENTMEKGPTYFAFPTATTKSTAKTKAKAPKAAPVKQPRNSVDEDVPVPKTKSSLPLKPSLRPSTLPSVPEEGVIQGAGPTDCIFKRTEANSGWLIPKETKSRVSLKRKSSVPSTVTKRNKTIEPKPSQGDESLFDSPVMPNLEEVASLASKRKTYVVTKKPETTSSQETICESVTDGIIPLEIIETKSPLSQPRVKDVNAKNTKENPKETHTRRASEKNSEIRKKTAAKKEAAEKIVENKEIEEQSSPVVKNIKNNKTKSNEDKSQKEDSGNTEFSNKKKESPPKNGAKETKTSEVNQEINIDDQYSKKVEVNVVTDEMKETKRIRGRPKKVEANPNPDAKTDIVKNNGNRKTLRERKPNNLITDNVDTIVNNGSNLKAGDGKNKKASASKPVGKKKNEHLAEAAVEVKVQNKKPVKKEKKTSSVNPDQNELIVHQSEAPNETEVVVTLGVPRGSNLKLCPEGQEKKTTAEKHFTSDKLTERNDKETGSKKQTKKVTEPLSNEDSADEDEVKQISQENLRKDVDMQQRPKKDVAVESTTSNTKRKVQLKSTLSNNTNKPNENNTGSQAVGASIEVENLKPTVQGKDSLVSTSKIQIRPDVSPEPGFSNLLDKEDSDEEHLTKLAEVGSTHKKTTNEELSKQVTKEKDKVGRKTNLGKGSSRSRSKKTQNPVTTDIAAESPEIGNRVSSTSGMKRKSLDTECATSSSDFASKRLKQDDHKSEEINEMDKNYSLRGIFGLDKPNTVQLQPGVVAVQSIHIHNFLMMGQLELEPGATISKISTNTTYVVQEGTACVKIKKLTRFFKAEDERRRFFIPKQSGASITNAGNLPLKMEFTKFRG